MSFCSPEIKNKICYDKKDLIYLCNIYNRSHDDKIIYLNKSKIKLFNLLNEKYNYKKHYNWLKDKNISKNFYNTTITKFKPNMPDSWYNNIDEWLSTIEINNILYQYEKKYDSFKFYGAVPADCPTSIGCKVSSLNITNLVKHKKNIIGIVYNLDTHEKNGSHWVSLIIDLNKYLICYFDSNGIKPNYHINEFIKKILIQLKNINPKNKSSFLFNKKQFQKEDGQCGIFAIYFILSYLKLNNFDKVIKLNMNDEYMRKLRRILFLN